MNSRVKCALPTHATLCDFVQAFIARPDNHYTLKTLSIENKVIYIGCKGGLLVSGYTVQCYVCHLLHQSVSHDKMLVYQVVLFFFWHGRQAQIVNHGCRVSTSFCVFILCIFQSMSVPMESPVSAPSAIVIPPINHILFLFFVQPISLVGSYEA